MDKTYADTVRLLLTVAPEVFRSGPFALKGGTALNLFIQDMPRLSVDIDVAYTAWSTPRDDALREISESNVALAKRLRQQGLIVRIISAEGLGESKLLVERSGVQVKVETNLVFRGTVLPIEVRSLAPNASAVFSAELSLPTLAADELYGSKIVAALDRQHPRDFFDVWRMIETVGLTDGAVECFVTYLAGHNRPIHEVLFPRPKDMRREYESSFVGMTAEPIELATLLDVRDRFFKELPRRLSDDQKVFLIGLARGVPDWSLLTCPHASDLPAIRWRLQNIEQFRRRRPEEFERQAKALEELLE